MTEEMRRHPLIGQQHDDDSLDPPDLPMPPFLHEASRSAPGDAPVPLSTLVRRVMAEALRRAARKLERR